jgi:transcriptional regulator with XRE-family HTH domain
MASKNIEFTARLKEAIKDTGLEYKDFAEKSKIGYTTLMNYLIPKGLGRVPEWDQLVKISNGCGKSIDWMLTGQERTPALCISEARSQYRADPMHGWPADLKTACHQLKNILLSNHPVIKPALLSNLAAFEYSIEKEKEQDEKIRKVNKRVKDLEDSLRRGQPTGTDEAASSSTGKPET